MPFNRLLKKVYRICAICGEMYLDEKHSKKRKYCSLKCRIVARRERSNEMRRLNREIGACSECGALREDEVYSLCLECRMRHNGYKYEKTI
jgi:endogenous inhibitor of DNA gyrase (YacG/DUF329 family)